VKLKMAKNSLFAILLRSHWAISLALAAALGLAARLLLPDRFAIVGMFGAGFPFLVIAVLSAWKQRDKPSAAQFEQTLQRLNAMNAREFGAALEAAFRQQGNAVRPVKGGLELERAGRRTLVTFGRWKAASVGVEPLRELQAAMHTAEADAGLVVATGELSDKARGFAAESGIATMGAAELVQLLRSTRTDIGA
jgi:restriction system protein